MVAAAVVAAGVITAGATAYSSSQASKAQSDSAAASNSLQQSQFDQTRADQQPYRDAGYSALSKMQDLLGLSGNTSATGYGSLNKPFDASSVATDPGYQFGLTQGMNSAQNSAAAKGGLYSGATLKALTQYGNDYATTKFDDAFNRDQTTKNAEYNKLAGISGTGQNATTLVDSSGAAVAANQGANLIGAGNARGASGLATSNAISGAANQAGAWWLRSGTNSTAASPLTTGNSYVGVDGNLYANNDYGGQTGSVGD